MQRIRRGDNVEVVVGRDKGKRGRVLQIDMENHRAVVEKLNLVKRHQKPTQRRPYGGIVEKEASLNLSNVRIVCPKCDGPRRIGVKSDGQRKFRACRKCGTGIEVAA